MIESMGEQKAWEYAKMEINYQLLEKVISPTLGDEEHHVFYSKYFKKYDPLRRATNIYLRLDHSIAKTQEYVIAKIGEIPKDAIPVCRYCGNELRIDKRGGCSACGGPAGKKAYK